MLLKRFPLPQSLGLGAESRIKLDRTWPAPKPAGRVKASGFYRFDPDSNENPSADCYSVDLDDCGPIGRRCPYLDQEHNRSDADVPSLLPQGYLRFLRDDHRMARIGSHHRAPQLGR
jgi:hypothetical protein